MMDKQEQGLTTKSMGWVLQKKYELYGLIQDKDNFQYLKAFGR